MIRIAPRNVLWWVVVLSIIITTGMIRQDARTLAVALRDSDTVLPEVRQLLLANRATQLHDLVDPDAPDQPIGVSFLTPDCPAPVKLIQFPISLVARNVVPDHVPETYRHQLQYYRLIYTGSRRPTLTLLWARHMMQAALGYGEYRSSKQQILLAWPATCDPPPVDWSQAWTTQLPLSPEGRT